MAIYLTGDLHGDFNRILPEIYPELGALTRRDYVIVCGDFGGVWGAEHDDRFLDLLARLPYTLLFVDGNHENFDKLAEYPAKPWQGGKARFIRPNLLHLLRGQIYTINGCRFFTMGGAASHDAPGGIFPSRADAIASLAKLESLTDLKPFRIEHEDWWREELPVPAEYAEARSNLERANWQVDYIVTHSAPSGLQSLLPGGGCPPDELTDFLDEVWLRTTFRRWFFGHYHADAAVAEKFTLLYRQLVRLSEQDGTIEPAGRRDPFEIDENGCLTCFHGADEEQITVPSGVTAIGEHVFAANGDLREVTLPDTVTTIERYAFHDCPSLETVRFGSGLRSIGPFAFGDCPSLALTLPRTLESVGEGAADWTRCAIEPDNPACTVQDGLILDLNSKVVLGCLDRQAETVAIPPSMERIGAEAFQNCDLKHVTLPPALTSIGFGAFRSCRHLEEIDLPAGITEIPEEAFYDCRALKTVRLPSGIRAIGECAFAGCLQLANLHLDEAALREIGGYAFANCRPLAAVVDGFRFKAGTKIAINAFEDYYSIVDRWGPAGEDGFCELQQDED